MTFQLDLWNFVSNELKQISSPAMKKLTYSSMHQFLMVSNDTKRPFAKLQTKSNPAYDMLHKERESLHILARIGIYIWIMTAKL